MVIKDKKCSICGSDNIKKTRSPEGMFFVCKKCGAISIDPISIPRNLKEYYSKEYYPSGYNGRSDVDVFKYRLPTVFSNIKLPAHILEVGAASGDFLNVLKGYGYEVEGVELSSRAAAVGRNLYNISIREGDLKSAHFKEASFDAVLVYHVLEHVDNPKELLRDINKVLKPSGKLILEVPNPTGIDAKLSKKLRKSIFDFPNHLTLFPPRLLEKLLKEAGFEVLLCETSFSYLVSTNMRKIMRGNRKNIVDKTNMTKEANKVNIDNTEQESGWKKFAKKIFPGMKIICVAQKRA